jgi:hypothetical protein
MATREQIRKRVQTVPFKPFTVNLAGGRSFTVQHPENVSCSMNGREMVVHDKQGMHFVEMLLVDVVEPVQSAIDPTSEGNGA